MSKKIAVLITDEFEDSEYTSPAQAYKQAGHQVVTIEKQAGNTVTGKKGEATVTIDKGIDEVQVAEFDALLLPGGILPMRCAVTIDLSHSPVPLPTAANRFLPSAMARNC
ncbi:conserved hypothetical protein [Sodalis glossinidius str. 'morsitans']|uniref:DJ-1/PfpI domain-containing protein n=1 Tax=Sodalis glossinidius (strain morsitans) TaxID=343509 RepID=Q2NW12_SODGM|nr:conserved hypothetical protein [Sodalis glossinidius str. 'morsitans']